MHLLLILMLTIFLKISFARNLPSNETTLQLPSTNPLPLNTTQSSQKWPPVGIPMRMKAGWGGYLKFRIDDYGPPLPISPMDKYEAFLLIISDIQHGPEDIGPLPQTYSHEGVTFHVIFLDDWAVWHHALGQLVAWLSIYTRSDGARDVKRAVFGPVDERGEFLPHAAFRLEIQD